jgi:hypothetical protein
MSEEDAPVVVAVTRTIGGVLLVIIGAVAALGGAVWYFVVPWFGWARDDMWYDLSEWADLGGAVLGIGGIVLLVIGGALIQRARKRRLQLLIDPTEIASPPADKPGQPAPPIV